MFCSYFFLAEWQFGHYCPANKTLKRFSLSPCSFNQRGTLKAQAVWVCACFQNKFSWTLTGRITNATTFSASSHLPGPGHAGYRERETRNTVIKEMALKIQIPFIFIPLKKTNLYFLYPSFFYLPQLCKNQVSWGVCQERGSRKGSWSPGRLRRGKGCSSPPLGLAVSHALLLKRVF